MPIATGDGRYFEDEFAYTMDQLKDNYSQQFVQSKLHPTFPNEPFDDSPTGLASQREWIEGSTSTHHNLKIEESKQEGILENPTPDPQMQFEDEEKPVHNIAVKSPTEPLKITVTPKSTVEQPLSENIVINQERLGKAANRLTGTGGEDRYQTWPEKAVRTIADSFKLPGEVWQGKEDPTSPRSIGRAAELAGAVIFGPAPVAKAAVDGTLGSIAGISSKTADITNLKVAQNLDARGHDREGIWQITGWYKGPDKRWRHELPVENAKVGMALEPPNFEKAAPFFREAGISLDQSGGQGHLPFKYAFRKWGTDHKDPKNFIKETDLPPHLQKLAAELQGAWMLKKEGVLSDYLDFPELYKAYPEFKNIKVITDEKMVNLGEFRPGDKLTDSVLALNLKLIEANRYDLRNLMLHEVQHLIQHKEKFVYGFQVGTFLGGLEQIWKNTKNPLEGEQARVLYDRAIAAGDSLIGLLYRRAPGEIEANVVELRSKLSPERRKKESPEDTREWREQAYKKEPPLLPSSNSESRYGETIKAPAASVGVTRNFPEGYLDKIPTEQRLSFNGITHPGFRWEIVDKQTGKRVGDLLTNSIRANRRVDALDNKYGGYRYSKKPVKAEQLTEAETKQLKELNINID